MKPARTVLLVSNYPSDTGYAWRLMERLWITLAEEFKQRAGKAVVAFPKINTVSASLSNTDIRLVEVSVFDRNRADDIALKQLIREHQISDIYLTDRSFYSLDYLKWRLLGVRNIVIHDHTPGDRPPVTGPKGLLKKLRNRLPLVCADKLISVSNLMQQRSILNGCIPPHKTAVVQNGIEPTVINAGDKASCRRELNLAEDDIVIANCSRAHPYKRFDFIIECARRLRDKQINAVYLLVGDGPALSDLKQQVQQHGLENHVRLLGFREDVNRILMASDIAFHASLGEAFSLSIVEYMDAMLPVLVPNIPSVMQAIDHGKTGYTYQWDSTDSACEHLEKLILDTDLRAKLGSAAKLVANEKYTQANCMEQFRQQSIQAFGLQ